MNNANVGPEFELPRPQGRPENQQPAPAYGNMPQYSPEKGFRNPELNSPQPMQQGPMQYPQKPVPPVSSYPQSVSIHDQPQPNSPSTIMSQNEVIDKKYVQKARKIISQTQGNPYEQNKALATLSAEYIESHYGKKIKVA